MIFSSNPDGAIRGYDPGSKIGVLCSPGQSASLANHWHRLFISKTVGSASLRMCYTAQ